MLTATAARELALEIYNDYRRPEQRRLKRIDEALQPKVDENGMPAPRIELPDDAPEIMTQLTIESETNYLPLLMDTYAQVMVADGYITENDPGARDPWETWQRNRLDSRQTGLYRSVLGYGTGYASAIPGRTTDGDDYAAVRLYSPKNMTALYSDDEWSDWPEWALNVTASHWELLGPGESHRFRLGSVRPTGMNLGRSVGRVAGGQYLTHDRSEEFNLSVTPVVRYHDRHYMGDEKVLGIIEPLLTVQRRLDRTSANQMIAQQIAIFRQKYVVGWVPESEEEEMKASISKVHYIDMDPEEVEMGEWAATQIDPYLNAGSQARRDFAAKGQIPSQAMGIDGISNISDATLAGLEAAKNRRAGIITTSIGESHEQLLRLFATIDGNRAAAKDFSSEVLWRDFESRSYGATIDGLTKLVGIGLPPEIALEDVPGMTGAKLQRVRDAMRVTRGREVLDGIRTAAAAATPAEGQEIGAQAAEGQRTAQGDTPDNEQPTTTPPAASPTPTTAGLTQVNGRG